MNKEYIITVFSENKVGLLSQITTVFTCWDINIESLTTSESSIPGIHKFTIVVITDPEKIEKLVKQIEKKIDVLKAFVFTPDEVVQQEIALYPVSVRITTTPWSTAIRPVGPNRDHQIKTRTIE